MKIKALYPMLLLLAAAMMPSCSSDSPAPAVGGGDEAAGYLQLAVTTDTPTRANPTGGEEGDGLEHGRDKENTIHNLNVFLYYPNADGLDGNQRVVWSRYVDSQTTDGIIPAYPIDRIYNVNIPLGEADMDVFGMSKDRFMRILIVANAGDLTELVERGVSVRGIADYTAYGNAWTVGGDGIQANSDYFVMSSAFNGVKRSDRYSRDGLIIPGDRIYTSEVNLERVAARIDLEVAENQLVDFNYGGENGGENVGKGLKYDIKEADHYLTITDIVPVNLMQQNSYLLKQVSAGTDLGENMNAVSRFVAGDEKTDAAGLPTNYVISPSFLSIFNNPAINNATYFGVTSSANLRDNYETVIGSGKYRIDRFGGLLNIPTDSWGNTNANKALLVTYSNENTVHEKFQMSNGVESEGENGGANGWKASDYITGLLFRAQYHPAKVYTAEDGWNPDASRAYTDGEDFWLFRTVEGETKESKNLYFASEAALNAYVATLPAGGRYETQYYPGGICYYNIWVKHANIDRAEGATEQNFPMKYGIVRNNIYRISLSFNGIGEPKPEITEPYNVTSRIFVVKWNFRPQPEIIM